MRVTDERLSLTAPNDRQVRADGDGRRSDDSQSNGLSGLDSLIVVSNRQPYRHEYEAVQTAADGDRTTPPSVRVDTSDGAVPEPTDARITVDEPTGGLTAGLDPVLQQASGTWIAWGDGDADFDVADEHNCVAVPPDDPSYTLQRIDLSEEAVDSYYYGFSNRVLWPLCHGFVDHIDDSANNFKWYQTINECFAEAVSEHATADSVVWLQDYHFALASRMIRDRVPQSTTVAQFWHIPWPTLTTFQYCPARDQILEGLLGNDLLGFHVDRYAERFLECVQRFLPAAGVDWERRTVTYGGELTHVVATPMGVDAKSYDQDAQSVTSSQLSSLFDRYDVSHENVIGLGVDRLDYTKGIPERLAAIERFLEWNPSWHGEFTFIQTATPSRTDIQTYEQHGALVRSEVERINQRFGTQAWDPIVYTEDYISAADLCALYRRAELMIVSPLADGMNLVAQEYVAASVDRDGTLVLSQDAGAHETLGSHALTIDPADVSGFAHQIERAVSLPPTERRHRMRTLRNRVFDRDLEWWMETQFDWIRYLRRGTDGDPVTRDPDSDDDSYERTPSV